MATKDDVQRVLAHVNRASDLAFFFDRLNSPAWIDPLRELGLFDSPPAPEVEGEYVRYPSWPASRYLARVADQAPESVLTVVRALPESRNPRVHEDIVEAAIAMPLEAARELVPRIQHWLETDIHLLLLPDRALELARRLALEGAGHEALALAKPIFSLDVESDGGLGQRVRGTRLPDHDFAHLLQQLVEPLARAVGSSAVRLFVGLLDDALRDCNADGSGNGVRFEDASTIWRRDVGDRSDRETRFQPVLNALVDAALDATELLAGPDLEDAFEVLEGAGATIFRRIAFELLADASVDVPRHIAVRLLLDRDALSDHSLELEYLRALKAWATELSFDDRRSVVEWIRDGPVRGKLLAERLGDEWDGYLGMWQARRLTALGDAVPMEDRAWAAGVVSSVDEADLVPERPATVATWVGPTSPKSASELLELPIDQIVEFLRDWDPSGDWAAPSPEGLGRTLSAAVLQRPIVFSSNAASFIGLEPVYVRSLISGLRDALKAGRRIRWSPVLGLCRWVVDQELGATDCDWVRQDRDPGWDWTWTEIARLLEQGLTEEPNRIPKAMVARARAILLRLIDHPDPSPDSEAQYGGSNMDPSTQSINTTRGEATHALVRLAWWEKKVVGRATLETKVRGALERLATPGIEPSRAVHSVFGRWFGTLTWLDKDWAAALVDRIFPHTRRDRPYWWAAWSAFIVFDRPTISAHKLLNDHYTVAIDRLGDDEERLYFSAGRDHAEALAAHVLAYAVWGIDADPEAGVLGKFLGGPVEGRAKLIEQAGRLLHDHGEDLAPSSVKALQFLWSQRRAAAQVALDDSMRRELGRFSWWCGASVLEVPWWLAELQWVLSRGVQLDAPSAVLEAMPAAADVDPRAAVQVIDAISRMPGEPWLIQRHRNEIAEVLATAISSDVNARRPAIRLIHELGARELGDFSGLLPRLK